MSSVLIIGKGKVGNATALSMPLATPDFHDPSQGLVISNPNTYRYAIVCVDTLQSGANDYVDLDSVVEYLKDYPGILVIRSTISPDKALMLNNIFKDRVIIFPEFMDHNDFKNKTDSSSRTVLGGKATLTNDFLNLMMNAGYVSKDETFLVSLVEACIIKLSSNAALATKVILFNTIYKICQDYNVPYDAVRMAIGADKRIGIGHTAVPSPDDGLLGFGGHCLPKDIKAIVEMDSLGFFDQVDKVNHKLGRTSKL